jgi:hypothetical protein
VSSDVPSGGPQWFSAQPGGNINREFVPGGDSTRGPILHPERHHGRLYLVWEGIDTLEHWHSRLLEILCHAPNRRGVLFAAVMAGDAVGSTASPASKVNRILMTRGAIERDPVDAFGSLLARCPCGASHPVDLSRVWELTEFMSTRRRKARRTDVRSVAPNPGS